MWDLPELPNYDVISNYILITPQSRGPDKEKVFSAFLLSPSGSEKIPPPPPTTQHPPLPWLIPCALWTGSHLYTSWHVSFLLQRCTLSGEGCGGWNRESPLAWGHSEELLFCLLLGRLGKSGCGALRIPPSTVRGVLVSLSFHTSKHPILPVNTWETKLVVKSVIDQKENRVW